MFVIGDNIHLSFCYVAISFHWASGQTLATPTFLWDDSREYCFSGQDGFLVPPFSVMKDGVEGVINENGAFMTCEEALDYEGYLVGEYNPELSEQCHRYQHSY